VRVGTRARTWEVRCAGEVVGLVVLFQERGLARDSVYVVRNPYRSFSFGEIASFFGGT
jgi:hypothetical protein